MTIRRLLAWSWTLVILVLCWLPRSMMPVKEAGARPFLFPNFDKVVHLGIFAVFAFLWMNVGPRAGRALFAGLALAILSEVVQELPIVHRDATFMDGVADMAGVVAGILVFEGLSRRRAGMPTV